MEKKRISDKVVFLDRDGVINQDSPAYIKSCEEFHFIPGSLTAIRDLTLAGFDIIIITNQSVINRKMVTPEGLEAIFEKMISGVEAHGGRIRDIFFCPHTPDDICDCRKPKPGLILSAKEKYDIDLTRSCMVGDSAKDILCANNAGCGRSVLVRTGNGIAAEKTLRQDGVIPGHVAEDLRAAAAWIIEQV